jgi:tricorn protease-like protein
LEVEHVLPAGISKFAQLPSAKSNLAEDEKANIYPGAHFHFGKVAQQNQHIQGIKLVVPKNQKNQSKRRTYFSLNVGRMFCSLAGFSNYGSACAPARKGTHSPL